MKAKIAALAVAASLTLAACGNGSASHAGTGTTAQASRASTGAYATLPPCTTWTASSGAVDVLRFHETGAAFTGTEAAGGFTAHLSGAVTGPGKFEGFAKIGSGITLRIIGIYTEHSVWLFHSKDAAYRAALAGHPKNRPFNTSNGCPP